MSSVQFQPINGSHFLHLIDYWREMTFETNSPSLGSVKDRRVDLLALVPCSILFNRAYVLRSWLHNQVRRRKMCSSEKERVQHWLIVIWSLSTVTNSASPSHLREQSPLPRNYPFWPTVLIGICANSHGSIRFNHAWQGNFEVAAVCVMCVLNRTLCFVKPVSSSSWCIVQLYNYGSIQHIIAPYIQLVKIKVLLQHNVG